MRQIARARLVLHEKHRKARSASPLRDGVDALKQPGVLVVANHPTLLDAVLLMAVMPNATFIVKAAMAHNPITCWIVSLAGYIPNDEVGVELVEKAGTQGVELLMWLAMRAALTAGGSGVRKVHSNYHIPISNTATGLMAFEVA